MLPRKPLPEWTPKQLALEYGVFGAREPPARLKGQIPNPEPEWLDEVVEKELASMSEFGGLSFKRRGLTDRQAALMLKLLTEPGQPCPRYIYLDHNSFTDVGVESLTELLQRRPELTEVELYHPEDGIKSGAPGVSRAAAMKLAAQVQANKNAYQAKRAAEAAEHQARVESEMAVEPGWRANWPAVTNVRDIYRYDRRTRGAHPPAPEIKAQLKALGQPVSGKVGELISRLQLALAKRGMTLPQPYSISKHGQACEEWKRLRDGHGKPGAYDRVEPRPDWAACAQDEYEAAIEKERSSCRHIHEEFWWSDSKIRYVVCWYAAFLSEAVDVPGSHGDPTAWTEEHHLPPAILWHRRAEMMYLVQACDLGEALAMRKEYNRLYNAHAAAAAKAEAAVADGSGGRPTATPAAVTLVAPAARQESVLGAVVGSSSSAPPAPALATSPVVAKPGETAAAGTSAVTATAGKKRTISDFFGSK